MVRAATCDGIIADFADREMRADDGGLVDPGDLETISGVDLILDGGGHVDEHFQRASTIAI